MVMPAIAAEGLTRLYDDHLAVDAVTFEVSPGEVFGLLGPNGAGKTTLLRMLAGVLSPTRGRASILGFDVSARPLEAKRRLGFLSGDTALYGRLSAREVLGYFGALSGLEKAPLEARITALSAAFGLEGFLDARCEVLSSGQKQRTNLARAFVSDPTVLILDEPTTGLDVISGRFVHQAIARAKAEAKAVLLSTHLMSEASELCDRIALLVRGRIRAIGSHASLLEEHQARSLTDLIVRLHEEAPAG
jgi:sodium transport system ATP-binding protein